MPWHDAAPWRERHRKPLAGPAALEAIERRVRDGDLGITAALRLAYMAGTKDRKPKDKEDTDARLGNG